MKKLVFLVVSLLILGLIFPVHGLATTQEEPVALNQEANTPPPPPTEGTPSPFPNFAENVITRVAPEYSLMANKYLSSGKVYIGVTDDKKLDISASTDAFTIVDTIGVRIWLQMWDPDTSSWKDVLYIGEFAKRRARIVFGGGLVNAVKGRYYRTKTHHFVVNSAVVEQFTGFSSYVYLPK